MGTHPIFESDFDCLTEMLSRNVLRLVTQARAAHTDKVFKNLDYYRPQTATKSGPNFMAEERERKEDVLQQTYVLTGAVGSTIAWIGGNYVFKLLRTIEPTLSTKAMASVEIDVSGIPEGKTCIFKWRGKPIFIKHRSDTDVAREADVNLSELRDPQTDADRVQNPEWLVVTGICTHLGCVPIANAGNFFGYFCPCHGSHYDGSGRIRQGPAPENLVVPPYRFLSDQVIEIGD